MPPDAHKRPLKAVTPFSPSTKRTKRTSGLVIANTLEWLSHDTLWDTVGDCASEAFMKKQETLEEYDAAVKVFLDRLSLLVCGLYQDQLMVIFRVILPNWYHTCEKSDKLAMSESFEAAWTWIDSQLTGKIKAYTRL